MNWLAMVDAPTTSYWYVLQAVCGMCRLPWGVLQRLTSLHLIYLGVSLYGADVPSIGPTVSVGEGRGASFDAVSGRWLCPASGLA